METGRDLNTLEIQEKRNKKITTTWRIMSPGGDFFCFKNLGKFIREHQHLFSAEELAPMGRSNRAYCGLSCLNPARKDSRQSWHGWVWCGDKPPPRQLLLLCVCEVCGEEFRSIRKRITCSDECLVTYHRNIDQENRGMGRYNLISPDGVRYSGENLREFVKSHANLFPESDIDHTIMGLRRIEINNRYHHHGWRWGAESKYMRKCIFCGAEFFVPKTSNRTACESRTCNDRWVAEISKNTPECKKNPLSTVVLISPTGERYEILNLRKFAREKFGDNWRAWLRAIHLINKKGVKGITQYQGWTIERWGNDD